DMRGFFVGPHPTVREEAEDLDLARLAEQVVSFLEFLVDLVLIEHPRIEGLAAWDLREVEQAGADRPPILIPLASRAVSEALRIGSIVKCSSINDRPVEEVIARIVRIAVRVENIHHRELADR